MRALFVQLLGMGLPILENVQFVFMLEDIPVSFREQLVRHRIGSRIGDQLGVDIVPDLAESTFWSQTMRVRDMGRFSVDRMFIVPDSIRADETLLMEYQHVMQQLEDFYNFAVSKGVAREDARQVLPMATTHRISWGVNLRALQHVLGNRTCWIAQVGLWQPVLEGILSELTKKVSPVFAELAKPPCWKSGKCKGETCAFAEENVRRMRGTDPFPPCPVWLKDCGESASEQAGDKWWRVPGEPMYWCTTDPEQDRTMRGMLDAYSKAWGLKLNLMGEG
jgi:thymidylate synthase ThyX